MASTNSLATLQRPQQAHCFLPQRAPRHCRTARLAARAAVDTPAATADPSSTTAVRKALLAHGWDLAWVDGVTGEMVRGKLRASVPQVEAAVAFLEGLGISLKAVEAMVAINKALLAVPVEAMQAVVDYAARRGVTGAALVSLLEAHPSLLTYSVSSDGKQLEKGPAARASVDVVDRQGGGKAAGVSYWRVGASFASAPVAPYKPSAM